MRGVVGAVDFNLAGAAILAATLVGLVSLAKTFAFGTQRERVTAGIVLAVSVVAVFLVAASDFAHTQTVLDRPLDQMNVWSQLVVAVLVAGLGAGGWETLKKVADIGISRDKTPPAPAPSDVHATVVEPGANIADAAASSAPK